MFSIGQRVSLRRKAGEAYAGCEGVIQSISSPEASYAVYSLKLEGSLKRGQKRHIQCGQSDLQA